MLKSLSTLGCYNMRKTYQVIFKNDKNVYTNYYSNLKDLTNYIGWLNERGIKDIQVSKKIKGSWAILI